MMFLIEIFLWFYLESVDNIFVYNIFKMEMMSMFSKSGMDKYVVVYLYNGVVCCNEN